MTPRPYHEAIGNNMLATGEKGVLRPHRLLRTAISRRRAKSAQLPPVVNKTG